MIYENRFVYALFTTVFIESIVVFILLPKDTDIFRKIASGILPSALTLPYIWFVFPAFFGMGEFYRWFSEIFAIVIELWVIYFISSISVLRAFFISFIANIVSFLLGILIFRI